MPCNDPQLRESLKNKIKKESPKFSEDQIERAITAACKKETSNLEALVLEIANQIYLIEYGGKK